jgi:hypothetical protein
LRRFGVAESHWKDLNLWRPFIDLGGGLRLLDTGSTVWMADRSGMDLEEMRITEETKRYLESIKVTDRDELRFTGTIN